MNNQHLIESLNKAMATRITPELWELLVDARDEIQALNAQMQNVIVFLENERSKYKKAAAAVVGEVSKLLDLAAA